MPFRRAFFRGETLNRETGTLVPEADGGLLATTESPFEHVEPPLS
jgi:hypothetical protein